MSNLIRLVYVSRANFQQAGGSGAIEPTVARILMQSRRNNPRKKIGGVLYYGDGCFFQCLEGQSDVVNELVAKIMQDERHSNVQILKVSPITQRQFNNWSMKYIPLESDISALLKRHHLDSFDPYQFSDEIIDDLVQLFVQISTPESPADQEYKDEPDPHPVLWNRILKFFGRSD